MNNTKSHFKFRGTISAYRYAELVNLIIRVSSLRDMRLKSRYGGKSTEQKKNRLNIDMQRYSRMGTNAAPLEHKVKDNLSPFRKLFGCHMWGRNGIPRYKEHAILTSVTMVVAGLRKHLCTEQMHYGETAANIEQIGEKLYANNTQCEEFVSSSVGGSGRTGYSGNQSNGIDLPSYYVPHTLFLYASFLRQYHHAHVSRVKIYYVITHINRAWVGGGRPRLLT